jgi:hypothetical protein
MMPKKIKTLEQLKAKLRMGALKPEAASKLLLSLQEIVAGQSAASAAYKTIVDHMQRLREWGAIDTSAAAIRELIAYSPARSWLFDVRHDGKQTNRCTVRVEVFPISKPDASGGVYYTQLTAFSSEGVTVAIEDWQTVLVKFAESWEP